jgi:hypothetical protein
MPRQKRSEKPTDIGIPSSGLLPSISKELFDGNYIVEREWQSRTAHFSLWRSSSEPVNHLVVKHCPEWTERDVAFVFQESTRLTGLLPENLKFEISSTPRAVKWLADPPCIVYEAISGEPVSAFISRISARQLKEDLEAAGKLIRRCGAALAIWHSGRQAHGAQITAHSIRDPVLKRNLFSTGLGDRLKPVFSTTDYSPYNILRTFDNALFIIDPPERLLVVSLHYDIARFLFSLDRYFFARIKVSRGQKKDAAYLRQQFVTGYSGSDFVELNHEDYLITSIYGLYFAGQRVRKRIRERDFQGIMIASFYFLRCSWRIMREALRKFTR